MLNNQILRDFLESKGFSIEMLEGLRGCNCNGCSLMNDIIVRLEECDNFDIEEIDNIIEVNDLENCIEGNLFESCIDCINDYSHRLYCKYCDYHDTFEIATEFVYTTWSENCYCFDCQNEAWIECAECGEIVEYDDAFYNEYDENYYCCDCYENKTHGDLEENYVYDYHEFIDYHTIGLSNDNIYFGFEIETASDDKIEDLERFIEYAQYDFPNWQDYFHIERDCSISGYEFVSQPLSYETLKEVIPTMTSLLKKSGFYVDEECGSHIHITRTEKTESKLFDMLTFFNSNRRFTLLFANRTVEKMRDWSNFYNNDINELKEIATSKSFSGRYKVINLTNSKTLEFRLFSGTLTHQKLIANVQLIKCLINENINGLSDYKDLLNYKDKYKLLYQAIKNIEHHLH